MDPKLVEQEIANALRDEGILTPNVLAYALATAQHEAGMIPKNEFRANPKTQARLARLQNNYEGGWQYHGRGLIQLTHRSNYAEMDRRLGLNGELVRNPDLANDPKIAAKILAAFFKDRGVATYAERGDFYNARKPVNGTDKAGQISATAKSYLTKSKQMVSNPMTETPTMRGDLNIKPQLDQRVSATTVKKGSLSYSPTNVTPTRYAPTQTSPVQSYQEPIKQVQRPVLSSQALNYSPVKQPNYSPTKNFSPVQNTSRNYSPVRQNYTPANRSTSGALIQRGQTLSGIASANKTTVGRLLQLNPQITNPNLIYAGQNIKLK